MIREVKLLTLVALSLLSILFLGAGSADCQSKVIELSYSSFLPPELANTINIPAWGKEIEKRSKGAVKVVFYYGGTLVSATKTYDGAAKGLVDIGHSCFSYTPGRFPLMEVTDLPGYTTFNAKLSSRVAHEIYKKFQPKELSEVKVLFIHCHTPGGYYSAKKAIKTLDDMKGMRIRSAGIGSKMVSALGGTAVGMPKSDEYDSLARGVVDGTLGAASSLKGWRIAEVCKYSTWYPKAGYANAHFVVMNKRKWDSLPKDIQRIIAEVSEEWVDKTGDGWNEEDLESIQYAKKMSHQFITLDAKEQARWDKALGKLDDEYLKNTSAKGLPGEAALKYRQELIEKYEKLHKSIF